MKYIRTKNGIYEIINENETFYECVGKIFISKDIFYHKDRLADTIEELCDEFVCDNKIVNVEHDLENNLWVDDKLFEDIKDIVYGAIWTDKGLIYVAKMNDKGELELLWVKV